MTVILDTDIAIEILRARNQEILLKWTRLVDSEEAIAYSPVVAAEIWAGAFAHEHALITRLLRPLTCLTADCETGQLAGDFVRQYAKSHAVDVPDALIAAAAIQHQAALWTRNRKHYPMKGIFFYA